MPDPRTTARELVALHPEATEDPRALRWVTAAALLPFVGEVAEPPAPLAGLVEAGVLSAVTVEPSAVRTTLGEGREWWAEGAAVRRALHEALADPAAWRPGPGAVAADRDARVAGAAEEVLAGPVGDYVRGHGGVLTVVGVRAGVVTVELAGACHGCAAAAFTLHQRFERELLARCPEAVEVRRSSAC